MFSSIVLVLPSGLEKTYDGFKVLEELFFFYIKKKSSVLHRDDSFSDLPFSEQ